MSIKDVDVKEFKGKTVFVRADLNVPLNDQLSITDDTCIRESLPMILYLTKARAKVVLASHLGRPKKGSEKKFSLKPVAGRLTELLGQKVELAPNCIGEEVKSKIAALKEGDVLLLENYILGIIKKIWAIGYNVLLVQKSILRVAVTDLSLHYLAKAKILVIKDVEREDNKFISKTLSCLPIANIEHFRAEKLGHADLVEEVCVGNGRVVKVTGIKNMGRTVSIIVRGTNALVLDEAARSLHDALCVIRCLVNQRYLIAGQGRCSLRFSRFLMPFSAIFFY